MKMAFSSFVQVFWYFKLLSYQSRTVFGALVFNFQLKSLRSDFCLAASEAADGLSTLLLALGACLLLPAMHRVELAAGSVLTPFFFTTIVCAKKNAGLATDRPRAKMVVDEMI